MFNLVENSFDNSWHSGFIIRTRNHSVKVFNDEEKNRNLIEFTYSLAAASIYIINRMRVIYLCKIYFLVTYYTYRYKWGRYKSVFHAHAKSLVKRFELFPQ